MAKVTSLVVMAETKEAVISAYDSKTGLSAAKQVSVEEADRLKKLSGQDLAREITAAMGIFPPGLYKLSLIDRPDEKVNVME